MKRLLAIALFVATAAIPASAQRAAGHGGFSGRGPSTAPAFRGGTSFSSPSHFSGFSRAPMSMARPEPGARSFYPGSRYPVGRVGNRFPNRYPAGRRVPSRAFFYGYPTGVSYVGYPYLDAPFYDDASYGDSLGYPSEAPVPYANPVPDPAGYGYIQPPEPPEPPAYEPDSQPPAELARPADRPEPEPAAVTTLIFNDARPPQKIQNYIATRSTITVIDGQRHRDIPIGDLNIPATIKANRDAGIGFQLPAAR